MFDQLPETYPPKNAKRPKAILAAALLQVSLVAAIIIAQMAMPSKLGQFEMLTTLHMAPPPPPPPPAGPPAEARRREVPRKSAAGEHAAIMPESIPPPVTEQPQMIAPTAIPTDVARVMDVGPPGSGGPIGGVPGGVPGGTPGGVPGGILGGVVGGALNAPPPAPPKEPVRVGGNVREPKLVHMVRPTYPPAAIHARVEGTVVLEATVTEQGAIDRLKVISGPPLLVPAAVAAVQNWRYEPTVLNGQPIAVILTARVNFSLANQ